MLHRQESCDRKVTPLTRSLQVSIVRHLTLSSQTTMMESAELQLKKKCSSSGFRRLNRRLKSADVWLM